MDTTNDFYSISSSFKFNKEITEFDANNKFIAVADDSDVIDIYSLNTFIMLNLFGDITYKISSKIFQCIFSNSSKFKCSYILYKY